MVQPIKTLIVDDELYSRDELKHLLSAFPSIQIVGEAESGEDAIMKALQLQPDVVFLDVEMPKMNGMNTAKAFKELKHAPLVVFATAYPQFAVEAFRYDVVDYLLKPYDQDQLHETINRILKHLSASKESEPEKQTGKLAVEAAGEILYLDPIEILYIVRDDKWTRLITKHNEYDTKMPLKDLENRLQSFGFFRIHKSFLVNLEYVNRLTPWFNGAYQLHIEGRKEMLSVSRNYVKALRVRLEI
ncbi:response regulator transcription factor [Neobacillus sp. MM2021_6]|uniref:LytTR family transcriptional regulator DNA-binding domain-containing protein n=1 Tax=Bacillaceae TaxID=186817 RepID=UPI00140CC5AC|nr:response regulator transcription factor [Neobacillus sp. MM2021_6]NHC20697.1 response regulator transcription factor [Bacillus sp. MM2020_4]